MPFSAEQELWSGTGRSRRAPGLTGVTVSQWGQDRRAARTASVLCDHSSPERIRVCLLFQIRAARESHLSEMAILYTVPHSSQVTLPLSLT